MKFNWGTGIFLFYSIFALFLIIVVIKSTTFDNSLVAEDYYARDITYQQIINKKKNSKALSNPLRLERAQGNYALIFPVDELSSPIQGTVLFYRHSSNKDDVTVPIAVSDQGKMALDTKDLKRGAYKAIVEWKSGDKLFYDEFDIFVN